MRRLTRIPSTLDPRDLRYPLRLMRAAAPSKPRLRPYREQPVLDQGRTPHCVGFAYEGFQRAAPIMTVRPSLGAQVYALAQQLDEWDGANYEGTSVRAGVQALQQLGVVKNYLWVDVADPVKGVQELADFIVNGYGTVIVGTWWYAEMDYLDAAGVMQVPAVTASPLGGHAWRVVWYNTRTHLFKLVNSWGPDWGTSGTAWITPAFLARLLREDGEACAPTEVKITGLLP